jgi:hypothetical protein
MRGWGWWAGCVSPLLVTADQWRTRWAMRAKVPDESAAGRVRLVADGGGLENR